MYSAPRQTLMNTHHYTSLQRNYYMHALAHKCQYELHTYSILKEFKQKDNKIYSLSYPRSCLYTDANKYCNILLKMHIFTMFSSPRACSCQNHGPKLSVSRLSWGQSLRLNQLPCLAGNAFTVFVPRRCTACLIHHNQTKTMAVMQLQYVSFV